jgi:hypothetical protein
MHLYPIPSHMRENDTRFGAAFGRDLIGQEKDK